MHALVISDDNMLSKALPPLELLNGETACSKNIIGLKSMEPKRNGLP